MPTNTKFSGALAHLLAADADVQRRTTTALIRKASEVTSDPNSPAPLKQYASNVLSRFNDETARVSRIITSLVEVPGADTAVTIADAKASPLWSQIDALIAQALDTLWPVLAGVTVSAPAPVPPVQEVPADEEGEA